MRNIFVKIATGLALILPVISANANAKPKIDYGYETLQIQNLMSRRAFLHSVGRNDLELELWAKKSPIRWAQNQGCWIGMESLNYYYNTINKQMKANDLKKMNALNPEIKNVPENLGVGSMVLHILTTPIIEIAGDGKTAKGLWYTPGAILMTEDAKTPKGVWMWERYGGDFIKEDGKWAILHLEVMTDFGNPMGEKLNPQGPDAAKMGLETMSGPGPGADGLIIPGPDIKKQLYTEFGPTRVPQLKPKLPIPYEKLNDTFEYADCN